MTLERRQWNFAASLSALIVLSVNIVGGWAFLTGKMNIEQWIASTSAVNGTAIGWIARAMSIPASTPTSEG